MAPTMTSQIRVYDASLNELGLLPDHAGLVTQTELNGPGVCTLTYPASGYNAALLRNDALYLAVVENGVESPDLWVLDDDQDDAASDDGTSRPVSLAARGVLAVLEQGIVFPQAYTSGSPNGMQPTHVFKQATVGTILLTLINRAKARGCFPQLGMGFTAANDNAGIPWGALYDKTYDAGVDLLTVITDMAASGWCDFRMDGFMLRVYKPNTYLNQDLSGSVVLRLNQSVIEGPRKKTRRGITNAVLGIGANTTLSYQASPGYIAKWGRREGVASDGSITSITTLDSRTATAMYAAAEAHESITLRMVGVAPPGETWPVAGVTFRVGDNIAYDQRRNADGSWNPMRVKAITRVWPGPDSDPIVTVEFNDIFVKSGLQVAQQVGAITGGSTITAKPPPLGDATIPTVPANLAVATSVWPSASAGVWRGQANITWDPVLFNTDGTDYVDHSNYLVSYQLGAATVWTVAAPVVDPALVLPNLEPNITLKVKVSAVDKTGNTSGYSPVVTVTVAKDTVPPPPPSTMTATTRLGVVTLTWNGLDNTGAAMPFDFQLLRVYQSTTATPLAPSGTYVDNIYQAGGQVIVTGLAYGTTYYFSAVAVDVAGNASGPGLATTAVPVALVNTDVIGKVLDGAKLIDGSVLAAGIADGTITAAKVNFTSRSIGGITTTTSSTAPASPVTGDIWIDTGNGNLLKRWSGAAWVSLQDTAIAAAQSTANTAITSANGKNTTFYAGTAPTATAVGDLWFDTSNGNKAYRASATGSGSWVSVQDTGIASAIASSSGKNTTFYAATAPTATAIGDLWFDTANGYRLSRASATGSGSWVLVQDTAIAAAVTAANNAVTTANGKNKVTSSASAPASPATNDVWIDTGNGNILKLWSGSAWVSYQDAAVTTASTNAAAAVTAANGKNTNYYQGTAPSGGTYKVGDLWVDTANSNRMSSWSGTAWVLAQDAAAAAATAAGKNASFVQSATPTATKVGDLWIDTGNGNVIKTWSGAAWVSAQDAAIAAAATAATAAQSTANGKNVTFYTSATPTALAAGDLWFDSGNGFKPYRATAPGTGSWVAVQDAAIAAAATAAAAAQTTANGKNKITSSSSSPVSPATNDVWIDTGNGNILKTWSGAAWVSAQDAAIAAAQSAAMTAQTTASGKNKVTSSASAPGSPSTGDVWIDTGNGNLLKTWSGSAWVSAQDAAIGAAQTTATTANNTALAALPKIIAVGTTKTFLMPLTFTQSGTSLPGSIVIDTPITFSNYMSTFSLSGFSYTAAGTSEIALTLAAYFYSSSGGTFINTAQTSTGSASVTARLARLTAAGTVSIILDLPAGVWQYPKIVVDKAMLGQTTPPDSFGAGWSAAIKTDLSAYDLVMTPPRRDINDTNSLTQGWRTTGQTTIDGGKITADTVTANQIAANAITAVELAAGAVIAGKIAAGVITSTEIAANTITAADIAAGTITSTELAANSVIAGKIAAGTITATEIAASTITAAKIAANTITAAQIAASAITATELASNSVIAGKIAAGTITATEIAASTITGAQIAANTITAAQIAAGTITSASGVIGALDAGTITTGTLDANRIGANTITADKVLIGVGSNLIPDPTFRSASAWGAPAGMSITAEGVAGGGSAKFVNTAVQQASYSLPMDSTDTEGSATYRCTIRLKSTVAIPAGGVIVGLRLTKASDATTAFYSWSIPAQGAAVTNYTVFDLGRLTIGAFPGSLAFYVASQASLSTGTLWVDNLTVEKAVDSVLIADGAVTAAAIAAGTITAGSAIIATAAISSAQIAAIDAGKITTGTLDAARIGADSITAAMIAAGAITSSELASNSVIAGKIAAGTITATEIAASTITSAQIAANTIVAGDIAAGTITGTEIAAGAITAAKIAADTITAAQIAAGAITSSELATGSVIAGKIAAGIITATEIASATITGTQIAANTIAAGNIAAGTITAAQIAAGTIGATQLAANSITSDRLVVGSNGANLVPNPDMEEVAPEDATYAAGWGRLFTTGTAGTPSLNTATPIQGARSWRLTYTNDTSVTSVYRPMLKIPVVAGETYYLEVQARASRAPASKTFQLLAYAAGNLTDMYGLSGTSSVTTVGTAPMSTTATTVSGTFTVPAGKTFLGIALTNSTPSDAGGGYTVDWDAVRVFKRVVSAVIDDGAITTAKVAALAIAAGQIAANAITADKIAAGVVDASKIQLGTFNSNQVADPSFEESYSFPVGGTDYTKWRVQWLVGAATAARGTLPRSGEQCLTLTAPTGADAVWVGSANTTVVPGTTYNVTAYAAKTDARPGGFSLRLSAGSTDALSEYGGVFIPGVPLYGGSPLDGVDPKFYSAVTRYNLSTNPNLTLNTTGWVAGYGTTGVGTALRVLDSTAPFGLGYVLQQAWTTAPTSGSGLYVYTGSAGSVGSAGYIPVTAALPYSGVVWVKPTAAGMKLTAQLSWYNSSNTIISSTLGTATALTAGQWAPLIVNNGVAPAGATHAILMAVVAAGSTLPTVSDTLSWCGSLVEQTTVAGAPFDGDAQDATWDGVQGASSSSILPQTEFTKVQGTVTIPAGIVRASVLVSNIYPSQGSTIIVDDVSLLPAGAGGTELTAAGVRLFDADGDESAAFVSNRPTTLSITGPDGTQQSVGPDGAGFSALSVDGVDTNGDGQADTGMRIYGTDFMDWYNSLPQGINGGGYALRTTSSSASATEAAYHQLDVTLLPGRQYKLTVKGYCYNSTTGANVIVKVRYSTTGTAAAITDLQLMSWRCSNFQGVTQPFAMTKIITIPAGGQFSVLLSHAPENGGASSLNASAIDPNEMFLEDIGQIAADTGIDRTGGSPPPTKKNYVSTWNASATRSYYGSGTLRNSNTALYQGTDSLGSNYAYAVFAGNAVSGETTKTIATALTGATITRVYAYLYANYWYEPNGYGVIKPFNSTTIPTTAPALTAGTYMTTTAWKAGTGRWVDITAWATTAIRGFSVGPSATGGTYAWTGHFNGPLSAGGKPQLRIYYTR